MKKIQKTMGAAVMSLGLVVGLAGFAGASSIDNTGYRSNNKVNNKTTSSTKVKNNNNLDLRNTNRQQAWSGNADTTRNTTVEDVSTGMADNSNDFTADVEVMNTMPPVAEVGGGGSTGGWSDSSIDTTGANSRNEVNNVSRNTVRVENNNNLRVSNYSTQSALTGDATASKNTTVGSVTTGDATNTNSSSVTIRVSNE